MSTQQDIYAAGSESRPPMLNKENYVPWSSRLLRYGKSRPNGKLIYNSILNGPYVRRMIPEPDEEVDVLRVDNFIQNSEHEYSESEDFDFDNPSVPLPPPEPPDKEFDFKIDFEKEISVVRSVIVKIECIDARVKFDVFNDENNNLSYFMFKEFSLLSAESEDTIFDPGISE
nr:ribonuclease H-like domain-containing protein [Tanacetum cinerariifolium]